jgi:hypothetical protein
MLQLLYQPRIRIFARGACTLMRFAVYFYVLLWPNGGKVISSFVAFKTKLWVPFLCAVTILIFLTYSYFIGKPV